MSVTTLSTAHLSGLHYLIAVHYLIAGVRIEADALAFTLSPVSASGPASHLALRSLHWRGATLLLELTATTVSFGLLGAGSRPLVLTS